MTRHAACLQCGYDLRGLPAEGVCPECEFAIERSLSFGRTPEDRRYFTRLARGGLVLTAALGLMLAGFILVLVGELFGAEYDAGVLETLSVYAGFVLLPIGWLVVATSPPWKPRAGHAVWAWIVTALAGASMGACVLLGWFMAEERWDDYGSSRSWVQEYGEFIMAGSVIIGAVSWIAGFTFLAVLARGVLRSRHVSFWCWFGAFLPLAAFGSAFVMPYSVGAFCVPGMWVGGLIVVIAFWRRVRRFTRLAVEGAA